MRVDEIKSGKVKEFVFTKVNEGYAASTINHMKNVVSGVLNDAVDDELIQVNPVLNLGRKFMKRQLHLIVRVRHHNHYTS